MTVENRAFELEYKKPINTDSLRDDIISYLGEYRFRLPSYDYSFFYSRGRDGLFALRDKYDGDSMKDKAVRAIKRNEKNNRPTNREEAELKGLQSLEQQINEANHENMVLWISPPGPKEEGYGNYGFVYIGTINERSEGEKEVKMTAIRIENPNIKQFNSYLSFIIDSKKLFQKDTEFLASPFVLNYSSEFAIKTLLEMFRMEKDPEIHERFSASIQSLTPVIDELIDSIQNESLPETQRGILNTLENLASKLYKARVGDRIFYTTIDRIESMGVAHAIRNYNFKPETVAGSCGASGRSNDILSNNIFNSGQSTLKDVLNNDHYDDYECPHCHKTLSGESKTNKTSWRSKCDHCGGNIHC